MIFKGLTNHPPPPLSSVKVLHTPLPVRNEDDFGKKWLMIIVPLAVLGRISYRGLHGEGSRGDGDVVLHSINRAMREEDNMLDQINENQIC